MIKKTDNGIEYDDVREIVSDEAQAKLTATEYRFKGKIVRRDVVAQLKKVSTNSQAENF